MKKEAHKADGLGLLIGLCLGFFLIIILGVLIGEYICPVRGAVIGIA